MITITRLHLLINCGFLILFLSIGGCSSSNVTNETSEDMATGENLEGEYEEGDEYGEPEGDELGLGDDEEGIDGGFEDTDFADSLPDEAPSDLENDPSFSDSEDDSLALEEEPGLPELPVAEEDSGLPEPPVLTEESAGLPELPVDNQDQFTSEPYSPPSFDDSDVSFSQEGPRRIPVKKIKNLSI